MTAAAAPRLRSSRRRRAASFAASPAPALSVRLPRVVLACLTGLVLSGLSGARAQAPLSLVDRQTSVASVDFVGLETLDEVLLRERIELTPAPSGIGVRLRRLLGEKPGLYPFDPVALKKDVVRVRNHHVRNGFPRATVRDSVRLDTARNAVDVWFLIEEGPILAIDAVRFGGPGGTQAEDQLPAELRDEWRAFTERVALQRGTRLDDFSLTRLRGEVVGWLRNRGYAFADAGAESFPDSTGLRADVRLKILAGPRATVDEVRVEGAASVDDGVVRREMPFRPGDLFEFDELAEGQREVFALGLFQLALVDLTPDQPRDSTVSITVRVREGPARSLEGFGGYFQEGGVTLRGRATHRNALGGARSLAATAEARTGIAGTVTTLAGRPVTDLQASLLFRQPYVTDRRVSLTLQPLVRRRDDRIENSRQAELSTSLVFSSAALRTAALTLSASTRALLSTTDEITTLFEPAFVLGVAGEELGGSLGVDALSLGLSGTFGAVDDPLLPRRGVIVRPSGRLTAGPVSTYGYGRARLAATGFLPLGPLDGTVRFAAGTLRPFGANTLDDLATYVSLRDVVFFAGGTNDVRGWGEGQLGPKLVNLLFETASLADEPVVRRTECEEAVCPPDVTGAFGLGGEAKVSGSVQVTVPVFGGAAGLNLFLDGGRVFAPARAYDGLFEGEALAPFREILDEEDAFRFGTGAGLQLQTPVGAVSIALGFKVNPSYLDSRDAQDVAQAYLDLRDGLAVDLQDPDVVAVKFFGGRPQLHFGIGQTF